MYFEEILLQHTSSDRYISISTLMVKLRTFTEHCVVMFGEINVQINCQLLYADDKMMPTHANFNGVIHPSNGVSHPRVAPSILLSRASPSGACQNEDHAFKY